MGKYFKIIFGWVCVYFFFFLIHEKSLCGIFLVAKFPPPPSLFTAAEFHDKLRVRFETTEIMKVSRSEVITIYHRRILSLARKGFFCRKKYANFLYIFIIKLINIFVLRVSYFTDKFKVHYLEYL